MEQERNDPRRSVARRVGDGTPADLPQTDDVMRWVAAGIIAAAALLGFLVLVAIAVWVLQPPGWLQTVVGVAMVAGTVFFAWLLASALRKDDEDRARRPQRR